MLCFTLSSTPSRDAVIRRLGLPTGFKCNVPVRRQEDRRQLEARACHQCELVSVTNAQGCTCTHIRIFLLCMHTCSRRRTLSTHTCMTCVYTYVSICTYMICTYVRTHLFPPPSLPPSLPLTLPSTLHLTLPPSSYPPFFASGTRTILGE